MDVSVIIVNFNTKDLLRDCLGSVYGQMGGLELEVIVVDNASTDGSAEAVRREFPRVRLITNARNAGFAGGNNLGMEAARGRYVLLLNPDTVIMGEAIEKTVRFADSHPEAAVVGCKVLSGDGTLQDTCSTFPSLLNLGISATGLSGVFPKSRLFGRQMMTWWDRNDTREVDAVAGCFMLARREAVERVGMMDERYFMYAEETDWCYRFRRAGWKTYYFHEARIMHLIGQSGKTAKRDMNLERRKSLLAFFRKNRGVLAAWAANALYAAGDAVRVATWWAAQRAAKLGGGQGDARRTRIAGRMTTLKYHVLGIDKDNPGKRKTKITGIAWRVFQVAASLCYVAAVAAPRRFLLAAVGRPRRELIVLGYHGVKDYQRSDFAWQMDRLLEAGKPYDLGANAGAAGDAGKPGTVPSLDAGEPGAVDSCVRGIAVTFDDAFANVTRNALRELAVRKIPCVIFAPAGSVGGLPGWKMREGSTDTSEPVMSADELRSIAGGLVRVGSHGVRHIRIGRLSDGDAAWELAESKRMLEEGVGTRIDLLAFPHGDWTRRTVELAREAGYARAFSIEPKVERADSMGFLAGRVLVEPDEWGIEFWLKLRGGYEWMIPVRWLGKRIRRKLGIRPKTGMPEGQPEKPAGTAAGEQGK